MPRSLAKTTTSSEVMNEEVVEEEVTKEVKKQFKNSDEIECVSITQGQYFCTGERSKDLYVFADADDIQYIRYDDLLYMVRRRENGVFAPRFVIRDKDFLEQHPEINRLYGQFYSNRDLKAILELSPSEMREKLKLLPPGIQDSLKTLAATEIQRGRLDSIKRIKVLDEFFNTNMLSLVAE